MVHILGIKLNDAHRARFALTKIYGVGHDIAHRLCARFQIHDQMKIGDLTPFQVTSLASFLSSPHTAPPVPHFPLASPGFVPPSTSTPLQTLQAEFKARREQQPAKQRYWAERYGKVREEPRDPLNSLKIESELRREIRENIQHHRMIGSWVGKRHAMRLPVRGQRTKSNAKNAKKLNHIGRYS
ncbi:S13-like H2TH domain-containing protein [Guyanagaster necrorhizus]|uniref:S13-like H2TH domain-containing protein n=1 Tax=Guyanagaster necrorhizus TaxID=856835 RepID=A0A9P8AUE4_9AGAR|nr:S13-like H2TH domain-containing protein [Guyanagaster necrorhizus MCA 3950]KAG7447966.1 S13-like H2TH domain-containing protein [Guyanagaster necrorhizus MCA 3950]